MNRTIFVGNNIYFSEEYVDEIKKLAQDYYDIIHEIELNCKCSIYAINEKLILDKVCPFTKDGKVVMNRYQEVRLKAIKSKCNEILKIIKEKKQ